MYTGRSLLRISSNETVYRLEILHRGVVPKKKRMIMKTLTSVLGQEVCVA